MGEIIDGKALAANLRAELKGEVAKFYQKTHCVPGLAVVLVGEDPASAVYVRNKITACEEVGIRSFSYRLPQETPQAELQSLIRTLSSDRNVHGILVQLPLPAQIDAQEILSCIPAEKDVDGFLPENIGRLALKQPCSKACTPWGCIELIRSTGVKIAGKHAVVVGRSNIVGKPAALMLLNENATVTVCHSQTKNLSEITRQADILIVAVGKAGMITANMVKSGSVVIDVGMNRVEGKLAGDVDFDGVLRKAGYVTPVPGGVGPMTITMLLKNTLAAAERIINV